jgi:hypothetical protein
LPAPVQAALQASLPQVMISALHTLDAESL